MYLSLHQVPQLENFSDSAQLHGRFILELKKRWPCQMHQGEHGELGYCYVAPSGGHTRLNTLRMKAWAAAIVSFGIYLFLNILSDVDFQAAGDATKHEPPNVNSFDGARDGRLCGPKACGRTGPHSVQVASASGANDTNNAMATLFTALLPLFGNLSRKRTREHSSSPESTPKRARKTVIPTPSPLPELGLELHACLQKFAELEGGIDLTAFETQLRKEDYTPDIIPFVDDGELRKITGATAGAIIRLKKFCKEWYSRYEAKRDLSLPF